MYSYVIYQLCNFVEQRCCSQLGSKGFWSCGMWTWGHKMDGKHRRSQAAYPRERELFKERECVGFQEERGDYLSNVLVTRVKHFRLLLTNAKANRPSEPSFPSIIAPNWFPLYLLHRDRSLEWFSTCTQLSLLLTAIDRVFVPFWSSIVYYDNQGLHKICKNSSNCNCLSCNRCKIVSFKHFAKAFGSMLEFVWIRCLTNKARARNDNKYQLSRITNNFAPGRSRKKRIMQNTLCS